MKNISLLGAGYGSTGYNAIMMGAEADTGFAESFFATCIGQIGILGTLLLYVFIIIIGIDLFKRYRNQSRECDLISLILIVSVTLESLFSASAISMLGTGLYFILAGISAGLGERMR
jgi:O-antigen ligase